MSTSRKEKNHLKNEVGEAVDKADSLMWWNVKEGSRSLHDPPSVFFVGRTGVCLQSDFLRKMASGRKGALHIAFHCAQGSP